MMLVNVWVCLTTVLYVFLLPDIDECRESPELCDENANCTNTIGSYQCACYHGYSGSGHKCKSKSCFFFLFCLRWFSPCSVSDWKPCSVHWLAEISHCLWCFCFRCWANSLQLIDWAYLSCHISCLIYFIEGARNCLWKLVSFGRNMWISSVLFGWNKCAGLKACCDIQLRTQICWSLTQCWADRAQVMVHVIFHKRLSSAANRLFISLQSNRCRNRRVCQLTMPIRRKLWRLDRWIQVSLYSSVRRGQLPETWVKYYAYRHGFCWLFSAIIISHNILQRFSFVLCRTGCAPFLKQKGIMVMKVYALCAIHQYSLCSFEGWGREGRVVANVK